MKGTIAKRFEELDWDNNGKSNPALYAMDPNGACMSIADSCQCASQTNTNKARTCMHSASLNTACLVIAACPLRVGE